MGFGHIAPTWFSRGKSYCVDVSGSFHLSTYSRNRARRSARPHTTCGLSIRPVPKRSMRCCKWWELEIRSRKEWLIYEGLGKACQ